MAVAVRTKAMYEILRDEGLRAEIRALVIRTMQPIFREIYLGGVLAGIITVRLIAERTGTKAAQDDELFTTLVEDPAFAARQAMSIAAYTNEWWQALDGSTQSQLERAILDAHRDGLGPKEVAKKIEPLFGRARAARIAVTETTRLIGAGAQASYRALRIERWDWRTAEDGRVCSTCDQMSSGGPYEMAAGFSPAHVSCRCWPVPGASAQAPAAGPTDASQTVDGKAVIRSQLTSAERQAFADYQDSAAFQLNAYLRTGRTSGGPQGLGSVLPKDALTEMRDQLDAGIARSSTVGRLKVYRGMSGDEVLRAAREGSPLEFTDAGFVSTTLSSRVARNYGGAWTGEGRFTAEIVVPARTPAIGNVAVGNQEIVLGRGGRFRVVGYREEQGPYGMDGKRMIDPVVQMEWVQ